MGILLTFHQQYQPVLDSILLSALVAGLPLYVLFVMLAILRLPAWMCALAAMLTAALLAWIVWGMPFGVTVGTATEGMAFGLWPISWIVLNAVFFHNLTVASGDFDVIRSALTRLTQDRRLQTLLIAFSFGALLEGIAGFGAPVAITASILATLVSMGCLAILLRYWRPAEVYRFTHEPAVAAGPRRVGGASLHVEPDLPGEAAEKGKPDVSAQGPSNRVWWAFGMYVVLVVVILVGQMGNLPFWSGHPPGDVKTALHAPLNVTADLKCGTPSFKLCPQPWIGPDPAKDRQAFKFPDWNFLWPGTYEIVSGQPVSLIYREKP